MSDEESLVAQLTAAIAAAEHEKGHDNDEDTAMVDPSLFESGSGEYEEQQQYDRNDGDISNIEAVLASLLTAGVPPDQAEQSSQQAGLHQTLQNQASLSQQKRHQQAQHHAQLQQQQQHLLHQQLQDHHPPNLSIHQTQQGVAAASGSGQSDGLSIAETLAITRSNMNRDTARAKKIDPMLSRKNMFQSSHYSAKVQDHYRQGTVGGGTTTRFQVFTPEHAPHNVRKSAQNRQDGSGADSSRPPPFTTQTLRFNTPNAATTRSKPPPITRQLEPAPGQESDHESGGGDESMLAALLLAKQMFNDEGSAEQHSSSSGGEGSGEPELTDEAIEAMQQALQALGKSLETEESSTSKAATTRVIAQAKKIHSAVMSPERMARIRQSNRARKQRWREGNNDRNKDNDLRVRVNKRANLLFGDGPSDQKQEWVDREYQKRRQRRFEKEMGTQGLMREPKRETKPQPSEDDGSDILRAMFESLKGTDANLTEAINTLTKDATLLKSLGEAFMDDTSSGSTSSAPVANAANANAVNAAHAAIPANPSTSTNPINPPIGSHPAVLVDHGVPESASMTPEPAVGPTADRDDELGLGRDSRLSDEFERALSLAIAPPQYNYEKNQFKTTPLLGGVENDKVKSMGFPPALTADAFRRG